MKKIMLFIALGLLAISCDLNKDNNYYTFDLIPVSSVTMPTAFAKDSITEIPVKFKRPSSCHFFDSFYYKRDDMTRTVGIYCVKSVESNCQPDYSTEIEVRLPFMPTQLGTYHFKFYNGENSLSAPQFFEYDVVVDH